MWRKKIEQLGIGNRLLTPAKKESLQDLTTALNVSLPQELYDLLEETGGVLGVHGERILPPDEIANCNLELRADSDYDDLYMPFDHMLIFASAGSGDLFFYPIQGDGRINRGDVFVWHHETDSRQWVAANLDQFVENLLGGKINV